MLMVISHCGISISSGFIALLVCANTRRATLEQLAEGCTSEFEVSSNISLSKRQLKKSHNYSHLGGDKWPQRARRCEAH